ncbi:hypothetical protein D7Y13_32045 [Corallococcus praedator]|uniref:Uncharacterized protein n=1 Tax=Corallococcus praedator TaxID=2316724 RepID=A0ABX9Q9L7_9BACT|nr:MULTISPECIES: hypothetical protein [Corallococcus]RKH09036.1 hypothetical protein D7X74_30345 [Corallococcus sp. CA047B]RKH24162.1 hypothetical protein D7X75_32440 [Corallococcus sp. CA031C]RKH95486.1 hypothetical protein D7Y13_32045 [Corallococcus praedator]
MARPVKVETLLPVEVDFQRERASGLRRSGDSLEKALAALSQSERELCALSGASRAARYGTYRALWKEAERLRWNLTVQREACGVRNHRDLDLIYPLPPLLKE